MDAWLYYWRPLEFLVVFMTGLCSGVVMTAMLFKDHERRLNSLEVWVSDHNRDDKIRFADMEAFKAMVKDRLKMK